MEAVKPPAIVLVHGESTEMKRLHRPLERKFAGPAFGAFMPPNNTTVMLPYEDELLVRVLGGLAAKRLAAGVKVSGVLVHKNYQFLLMAPADVAKHTPVATHTVAQVQHVPCRAVRNWRVAAGGTLGHAHTHVHTPYTAHTPHILRRRGASFGTPCVRCTATRGRWWCGRTTR